MDGKRMATIRQHLHSFLFSSSSRHSFRHSAKRSLIEEEREEEERGGGGGGEASSVHHHPQGKISIATIEVNSDEASCSKITILPAYSKYLRHDQLRREQELKRLNAGESLAEDPLPKDAESEGGSSDGRGVRTNRTWQRSASFQSGGMRSKVGVGSSIQGSVTPDTNHRFSAEGQRRVHLGIYVDQQSDSWMDSFGAWKEEEERSSDGSALPIGVTSNNDEVSKRMEQSSSSPQERVSEEMVRSFFDDTIMTSFKGGDLTVRDVSINDVAENDVVDAYLNSIREIKPGSSQFEAKHPHHHHHHHPWPHVTPRMSASRSLEFDQKVFGKREFDAQRRSWSNREPSWTSPERWETESERSGKEDPDRLLFGSDLSPERKTDERSGSLEASVNSESSRSLLTSSSYMPYMCDDLSDCYRHLAYKTFPFSTGRRSVEERLEAVSEELGLCRHHQSKPVKTVRFAADVAKYPSCEGFSATNKQRVSPRCASVEMSRLRRELQEVGDKRMEDKTMEKARQKGDNHQMSGLNEVKMDGTQNGPTKSEAEANKETGSESPVWRLRVPIIRITKADDDDDDDGIDEILDATNGSNPAQVIDSFAKVIGRDGGNGNIGRPVVGLSKRKISEQDLQQVEMFYRSYKTELFVCRCRVTLFFGSVRRHSTVTMTMTPHPDFVDAELNPESKWTPTKSGILLIVLDSGESRRHRKLYITLAEIGSGFMLWRDCVDHLTNYCNLSSIFHTMHLSHDHTRLAGFLFEDNTAAADFYRKYTSLVSNKEDTLLNLSRATTARRPQSLPRKSRRTAASTRETAKFSLSKADISGPCCFTHVTRMDRSSCEIDVERYLDSSSFSSSSTRLDKSPIRCIDVSLLMQRSSSRKFKGRNLRINVLKSSK